MAARVLLAAAVAAQTAAAVRVTFNNTLPRLDVNGNIVDAHDGSVQQFEAGGLFWMHAVSYGLCKEPANMGCDQTPDRCGFQLTHNITIWTSPDLSSGSWTYVGVAISVEARPAGIVFRPEVVYNPNTQEYNLWWNWVAANGTYMGYAAATASTPAGPFQLRVDTVPLIRNNDTWHAGDFHRLVDDDGTGYVIYSSNHWMAVEQLTPDFLSTSGRASAQFPTYFVEAPVLFKRNGLYYALFGHCCCFCLQGSGVMVWTAQHPLGPWTEQAGGDIACVPPTTTNNRAGQTYWELAPLSAEPTPGQGCLYNGSSDVSVTRSQQNFVIRVPTPQGEVLVWTGDRWQQAPDGIKGHEPQAWLPLAWEGDNVTIAEMKWVDAFELDVAV